MGCVRSRVDEAPRTTRSDLISTVALARWSGQLPNSANRFNGFAWRGTRETVETVQRISSSTLDHRAEATVLMRSLRVAEVD